METIKIVNETELSNNIILQLGLYAIQIKGANGTVCVRIGTKTYNICAFYSGKNDDIFNVKCWE